MSSYSIFRVSTNIFNYSYLINFLGCYMLKTFNVKNMSQHILMVKKCMYIKRKVSGKNTSVLSHLFPENF